MLQHCAVTVLLQSTCIAGAKKALFSKQANPAVSSCCFALAPLRFFKFVVPHEEANCHFWQVAYTRGTIHIGDTIFVIRGCAILLSTSHRAISTSHMRTF